MPQAMFLTLDKKGRATIPEEVRTRLGVSAGDFVMLEPTQHGTFELVPATLVPTDQLWFHHPEMQQRVHEAERSFQEGEALTADTPDQAVAVLARLKQG